jgi:hypothetical protein
MKLEEELRRALSREHPADGFAGRVDARIQTANQHTGVARSRRRMAGIAMAATIAIGTVSTLYYSHQRQIAEAERVRVEAVTGLRIASAKLNDVHDKLVQRRGLQNERLR